MNRQDLLQVFILSNDFKEGDLEIGGTLDNRVRSDARQRLDALRLREINETTLIGDNVSETLARSLNSQHESDISNLTIAELKRILLSGDANSWLRRYRDALSSESIAAVAKVMTNEELSVVARYIFNPIEECKGISVGSKLHFGSRIQPNSPGDDEEEVLFSILEGLTYGCGDVILGVNPASNDVETIIRIEELLRSVVERLELPTRYCVLSDIVKQSSARTQTKVDVGFQSLAGTSQALYGMVGLDVDGILDLARGFQGLYFETGQGLEVTNGASGGVDMVTLEARTYGVARYIHKMTGKWMIVNDVAGFIGPEVFRTEEQLLRVCLEDSVMAKLHGLTMGLDVCSTFHMGIEPGALRKLTESVVDQATPAYLMAIAGNADPMLGYLSTSFREHPQLRRRTARKVTTPMCHRLAELKIVDKSGELLPDATRPELLYALYVRAGGKDKRALDALRAEGASKIEALRERGYDLGYGNGPNFEPPTEVEKRLNAIYGHARQALYKKIDETLIKDVSPKYLRVRTSSRDRNEYLSHPSSGEKICREDTVRLLNLYKARRKPQLQFVISDGLNADSQNENLRAVLPRLRRELSAAGYHVADVDIFVDNGRVRAGYHIGELLDVDVIVHLIGERPGTGLNTLSVYVTYGKDSAGQRRWSPDLDHSHTNAVCGVHPKGRSPVEAVCEIARLVVRIFEEQRSGVSLGKHSE